VSVAGGIAKGIPAATYHADPWPDADPAGRPSLSSSIAKLLCTASPAHAWAAHPRLNPDHTPATSVAFDLGTAAHSVFLEGVECVETIEASDYRTKVAQEARDEIRARGRVPLLADQWQLVQETVATLRGRLEARSDDPPLFAAGDPEVTVLWKELGDEVLCRSRLDWLRTDATVIDDLKITSRSAHPASWARQVFSLGYDVQSEFYRRGIETLTGTRPTFRLVVVELEQPHAVSVLQLAPDAEVIARKKVDYALELWRKCVAGDSWPAYRDAIAFATLPAYEESRWLELELEDPYDVFGGGISG